LTITFAIDLGNLHPMSLCDEPWLWWLGFLLHHHLLWLCFRGDYLPVYGLNPDSPGQAQRF